MRVVVLVQGGLEDVACVVVELLLFAGAQGAAVSSLFVCDVVAEHRWCDQLEPNEQVACEPAQDEGVEGAPV